MPICGGCLCGGIKYEIQGKLSDLAFCHCSECRKALGSAFAAYARVSPDEFKWMTGEDLIATYESSPNVHRCFCRHCGSPLGGFVGKGNKLNWVALGTVTGDPGVRPEAHIFVGSKATWYQITDKLPQFDEWPPKTSKFFMRFG